MSPKPIVISGSGLSALLIARMVGAVLRDRTPILVVEQNAEVGGQFLSFDYGPDGRFDHGMHIYYESSIPEVDTLFTGIFPEDYWHILEGNRKDIAGLFVNGRLQLDTPYVDLRAADPDFRRRCIAEILLHVQDTLAGKTHLGRTAYDAMRRQFGEFIADRVFVPVFEKLYRHHPRQLDELATHLTAVNRLALFDEAMTLELMRSEPLRARICYPDQLTMPPFRTSGQRGFYPRKYGMFRVIERLREILERDGTRFLTSSSVSAVKRKGGKVTGVTIRFADGMATEVEVDRLFWTAGLPGLAKLLGIDLADLTYDRNNKDIHYVNFLWPERPAMGELYYFYCFEPGCRAFRVTSYANYCPGAAEGRGHPLCAELWTEPGDPTDAAGIVELARRELVRFGVVPEGARPRFARAEKVTDGGFPLPSVNNVRFLESTTDRIRAADLDNLEIFGVYSSRNTFFIKDILTDAHRKLTQGKRTS